MSTAGGRLPLARLGKAVDPRLWRDLAVETWWRARPRPESPPPPSWPLVEEALAGTTVRWPEQYDWPLADTWLEPVRRGLARWVRVESAAIEQPYRSVAILHVVLDGAVHEVALDYSDFMPLEPKAVSRCPVYFKMQHAREGYGHANVVPGGYISRDVYPFLGRARSRRERREFAHDVYGRFSPNRPSRKRALADLTSQSTFAYVGGPRIVRYSRSLREAADAKVCVDLPGRGDFCFRLLDYLAIGSCVVGPPHRTVLHVPLVDGVHIARVSEDMSDLVDVCAFYVRDGDARERLARQARDFFDRYLHRDQIAAYYLHTCLERLG
jgi:hypothetical protein